ncbi:MAG: hypothetical protein Q8R15_00565 [Candidatus Micrarchaeota archaeon]|nr:hypothetical protein [Candidatus Micrarchaeota archaeon]
MPNSKMNLLSPSPNKWRFLRHATTPIELPYLTLMKAALLVPLHATGKKLEEGIETQTSLPSSALAMQVFRRLSELTTIPQDKLLPKTLTHPKVNRVPFYSPFTHELVTSGKTPQLENHEMLHATQYLLTPHPMGGFFAYRREREPTADHMKYTGWEGKIKRMSKQVTAVSAFTAAVIAYAGSIPAGLLLGAVAAGHGLSHIREMIARRAIKKYGRDGWIALHAQGRFDPLFSGTILHSLERRGFITKNGLTQKGEQWIASLKPEIETRLKQIEENRREMREEIKREESTQR